MRLYRPPLPAFGFALATFGLATACAVPPALSVPAATVTAAPPPTTTQADSTAPTLLSPPIVVDPPEQSSSGHSSSSSGHSSSSSGHASSSSGRGSGYASGSSNSSSGDGSVNCGKVGPRGGRQVDLIADETQAGIVGCTEAIDVITEYYQEAPTKAQGTLRQLNVQGFTCAVEGGSIICGQNGLRFHTQP